MKALFSCLYPFILASGSPRRQQFLQELGVEYRVVRPRGVEPAPQDGEQPERYALRAATAKAEAVAGLCAAPQTVVLAADTVVALEGNILGKPENAADALRMLRLLAGRTHRVISAVSVFLPGGDRLEFHDSTEVRFHAWPDAALAAYARSGEPLDKAGAYAIQGQGAFLVDSIAGSWSTVVGLPVTQLVAALLARGILRRSLRDCLYKGSCLSAAPSSFFTPFKYQTGQRWL